MPKYGNPFRQILARDILALFGAHNLTDPYETGRMSSSPQKIQVHDDYNPSLETFDADIAILTFEAGAITFSTHVQPICLWNKKTQPTQTEGHIGGWGQSENLENNFEEIPTKLVLPIHANDFCFLTTKDLVDLASNRTFCAGRGDGTGICTGDSGGGVSIIDGSTFYFRGIVSSGLHNQLGCDVSKFSIFTDVLKFKPWIHRTLIEEGEIWLSQIIKENQLNCTVGDVDRWFSPWNGSYSFEELNTCRIKNQAISAREFTIDVGTVENFEGFSIVNNKEVKFLPENIAESFPELIAYRVADCSITTVDVKHFCGLKKLQIMILKRNEIRILARDSFKELSNLRLLELNGNKIKTIDLKLFSSLTNLFILHLENNEIESLSEQIFNNLKKLTKIYLNNNNLTIIPEYLFINNLDLYEIHLGQNRIQTIWPMMFDHLKSLDTIKLESNICIDGNYDSDEFLYMKNALEKNCL